MSINSLSPEKLACFLSSADFPQNNLVVVFCRCSWFFFHFFFCKMISGIPSGCQTVWMQIRPNYVGPDLGPNCFAKVISRRH